MMLGLEVTHFVNIWGLVGEAAHQTPILSFNRVNPKGLNANIMLASLGTSKLSRFFLTLIVFASHSRINYAVDGGLVVLDGCYWSVRWSEQQSRFSRESQSERNETG